MSRRDAAQEDMAIQVSFERQQRQLFEERVCRAARMNPDMTLDEHGERFNRSGKTIGNILRRHGLPVVNAGRSLIDEKTAAKINAPLGFHFNNRRRL